jgi:hypothetical protein
VALLHQRPLDHQTTSRSTGRAYWPGGRRAAGADHSLFPGADRRSRSFLSSSATGARQFRRSSLACRLSRRPFQRLFRQTKRLCARCQLTVRVLGALPRVPNTPSLKSDSIVKVRPNAADLRTEQRPDLWLGQTTIARGTVDGRAPAAPGTSRSARAVSAEPPRRGLPNCRCALR